MNLVLVGYRGTGKSTIGRRVAVDLGMPYTCLDEEIVRRAGMVIPEIVRKYSWEHFRELESTVVADFAAQDRRVLDTGGGVVTRPENVARLRRSGLVFWLSASVEDIVARISESTDRPSLTPGKTFLEEVEEVLQTRRPLYQAAAHHTIDTSSLSVEEAARLIGDIFRAACNREHG